MMYYSPNENTISIWTFIGNNYLTNLKKKELVSYELDFQYGEIFNMPRNYSSLLLNDLHISTKYGILILKEFNSNWIILKKIVKDDFIIWNIDMIINEFYSD